MKTFVELRKQLDEVNFKSDQKKLELSRTKVKNTEVLSGDQKLSLESIMDSLSVNEVEKVIRNLWKKVKESSG